MEAPKSIGRVIDLVREAGVDVSTWKDYAGGKAREAANPKYCYEWAFIQPGRVVVLNLWHDSMQEKDGTVFQDINMRERAEKPALAAGAPVWVKRARHMDRAIRTAYLEHLPVRVIVCAGARRNPDDPYAEASKVRKRVLDASPWAVTSYAKAGQCRLTRGAAPASFVDQFAVAAKGQAMPVKIEVSGTVFKRDPEVRKLALLRAGGHCEFCGQPGFAMANGNVYLETHHIVPLSEGGADDAANVAALCPGHHREAHHGTNATLIREVLLGHFV